MTRPTVGLAFAEAVICACLIAVPHKSMAREVRAWDYRIGPESFGGAKALKPEHWVTSDDYPEGVVGQTMEGIVSITFDINTSGRAHNCTVAASSGYSRIDEVPCRLVMRRARFRPLRSSDGQAMPSRGVMRFGFRASQ